MRSSNRAFGFLIIANNGEEALAMLRRLPFDCVLMDVQMPVMDGFAATRQVRADAALANTPIVAMTANVGSQEVARCLAAGMDDFVTKPIRLPLLFAALQRAMEKRGVVGFRRGSG